MAVLGILANKYRECRASRLSNGGYAEAAQQLAYCTLKGFYGQYVAGQRREEFRQQLE